MERLTMTSDKGGVAFTFDLDITCSQSEAQKILKLAERLKEYEDLEEQGLLLKLPCKVGDTVYSICYMEIEETIVGSIEYSAEGFLVWGVEDTLEGILGDGVFLTKEEAEQALKRLESES